MVTLVLVGLLVLAVIFFWPAFFLHIQTTRRNDSPIVSVLIFPGSGALMRLCLVASHILLLIRWGFYLHIHRQAFLPIRHLIMPILMMVMKSEAVRKEESTWYYANAKKFQFNSNSKSTPSPPSPSALLMESFSRHVRRDNKRKLHQYKNSKIQTVTSHIDTFSLWKDVPVIINHERKAVSSSASSESFLEAFIQRFLVVFMVTNAFIDRYYEENDVKCEYPIAFCIFVQNGTVLQSLMYFCVIEHNSSGIWHYQIMRMMLRAQCSGPTSISTTTNSDDVGVNQDHSTETGDGRSESDLDMSDIMGTSTLIDRTSLTTPLLAKDEASSDVRHCTTTSPIEYVNFQTHQDYAKKCVGASEALWDDDALMETLYPIQFFHEPPKHIVHLKLDVDTML